MSKPLQSFNELMAMFDASQSRHRIYQHRQRETNALTRLMYERVKNGETPVILIAMISDKLEAEAAALAAWEKSAAEYAAAATANLTALSAIPPVTNWGSSYEPG